MLLGDEVVADHPRHFRRDQIIYDPWHYLPVLMKKPGALRNGAPFKDWALPPALTQVRAKLKQHADGDRQFVKVLGAVLDHGLAAVEAACAEALEAGIASGDVILTVLARRRQPATPPSITTPDALRLKIEPTADCGRPHLCARGETVVALYCWQVLVRLACVSIAPFGRPVVPPVY